MSHGTRIKRGLAEPAARQGGAPWLRAERPWLAVLEVLLVAALYAADVYGLIPLSTTPFFFLIGWVSLRARGERWRDVGFTRPPRWVRALLIGAGAGAAMEIFSTYVSVPLLSRVAGAPPDLSDLRPMVGNLGLVLALLVPMWLLAAFGEELVFRGYLMNRVAGLGGRTPAAWLVSLVVVSVAFGTGHDYQGLTGMIQESLAGLMLGALYLAAGRNLALPIVAHGVSNTVAFALIYCGWYPGV
jgi:uncharacterized protein